MESKIASLEKQISKYEHSHSKAFLFEDGKIRIEPPTISGDTYMNYGISGLSNAQNYNILGGVCDFISTSYTCDGCGETVKDSFSASSLNLHNSVLSSCRTCGKNLCRKCWPVNPTDVSIYMLECPICSQKQNITM